MIGGLCFFPLMALSVASAQLASPWEVVWDMHSSTTGYLQPAHQLVDRIRPAIASLSEEDTDKNNAALESLKVTGCDLELDLVILQDLTASYVEDLLNIQDQMDHLITSIQAITPSCQFGVTSFRDKPFPPLGAEEDWCYEVEAPLSSDPAGLKAAFTRMRADGGMDLPEAQFTALINAALDARVGWRSAEDTTNAYKLIIMITDAQPHLAGDALKYSPVDYPSLPRDLPPHWGGFTQSNPSNECLNFDYPTAEQVRDVLQANDINLALVTPDTDSAVIGAWEWVNESLLGQDKDMYVFGGNHSSGLTSALVAILTAVYEERCVTTPQPTTTLEPTTTVLPTTTIEPTTTVLPTTTIEPTTTVLPTTTIEPTTTVLPTTTIEPTTTVLPTTTVVPTTTVLPTTTAEPTTTLEASTTLPTTTTAQPSSTSLDTTIATAEATTLLTSSTIASTMINVTTSTSTTISTSSSQPESTDEENCGGDGDEEMVCYCHKRCH